MHKPSRVDRNSNIKILFSDILNKDGYLADERENVLFLYRSSNLDVDPNIKSIFSRFEPEWMETEGC